MTYSTNNSTHYSKFTPREQNLFIIYTAVLVIAVMLIAMALLVPYAYRKGVQHAIEDSVIFTVDLYDPDNPEASAWGEYDQVIYIELDDNTYVHGMYQG